jgi:hypothetical protein
MGGGIACKHGAVTSRQVGLYFRPAIPPRSVSDGSPEIAVVRQMRELAQARNVPKCGLNRPAVKGAEDHYPDGIRPTLFVGELMAAE